MLPGYVAGLYRFDECHIDLVRLARFAGARLIHDEAIGLDRAPRHVSAAPTRRSATMSCRSISARRRAPDDVPGAAEHTISVKPIARFAARWEALAGARARMQGHVRLAIVGGGAGGVELALVGAAPADGPARHRARGHAGHPRGAAAVAQSPGAAHFRAHSRRARHPRRSPATRSCGSSPAHLIAADGSAIPFDEALWVTEAAAAPWLAETGLPLDERGFVVIDETLRSPADAARLRRRRHRDDAGPSAREGRGLCRPRGPAARRQSAPRARRQAACGAPCRNAARWR